MQIFTKYQIIYEPETSINSSSLKRAEVRGIVYDLFKQLLPFQEINRIHNANRFIPWNGYIRITDKNLILYISILDHQYLPTFVDKISGTNLLVKNIRFHYKEKRKKVMYTTKDFIHIATQSPNIFVRYITPIILSSKCQYKREICLLAALRRRWNYFNPQNKFSIDLSKRRLFSSSIKEIKYNQFSVNNGLYEGFTGAEKFYNTIPEIKTILLFSTFSGIGKFTSLGYGRTRITLDNKNYLL